LKETNKKNLLELDYIERSRKIMLEEKNNKLGEVELK
jgi:hypothetical protein